MSWIPNSYARGELVVVVDCADLERAARFWAGALGYLIEGSAGGRYQSLLPADGPGVEVLLQRTADAKHGKNRVHLDLYVDDPAAEVARVEGLGARKVGDPVSGGAECAWWQVMADPETNEFCVCAGPA